MSLPYVTSPGNIDKALTAIKNAAVPDTVSQDFVKTILKIPGGSGDQMTSFLKKLGLTNSDGSPNEIYKRFRNPTSSGHAIATAIKTAYRALYVRNEFMHELTDSELLGLLVEETGQAHDSNSIRLILSCIKHLKQFASFDSQSLTEQLSTQRADEDKNLPEAQKSSQNIKTGLGFNLGYTINLNLPATSDPTVFDAIFRALKEHLLSNQDG